MFFVPSVAPAFGLTFDSSVIIGTLSLAVLYGYLVSLARKDGQWGKTVRAGHVIWFGAGLFILFLTLQSPLDTISDTTLFSAHMTQHILLALIVPACLLLGLPSDWASAPYELPFIGRILSILSHPIVAALIFNGVLWIWHLPGLYEGALRDENVHIVQHLTFIAVGTLLWLPILHHVPPKRSIGYLTKIALLFFSMLSSSILAAMITFAPEVIYPFYGNASLAFGLTPLADQQLAGVIMWIPGGAIFLLAISVTFFAWLNNEERKGAAQFPPPPGYSA